MRIKGLKKCISAVVAVCVIASSTVFTYAADSRFDLIFTDITNATDTSALKGEAKIKVSARNIKGKADIIQTTLNYTGDMEYDSIQFLIGENNPPACALIYPNDNAKKGILQPSIVTDGSGVTLNGETDLFIITFKGEPGEGVTLTCNGDESTYIKMKGDKILSDEEDTVTASASDSDKVGITARIKLVMDKVTDFTASSDITFTITNESTGDSVRNTVTNNERVSSETVPTFLFENTLTEGSYTVELSGIGYITYKKTGISFDDILTITNADFIPGDLNGDGIVDDSDKALYEQYIEGKEYNEAADVNRDGRVDTYDNVYSSSQGSDSKDDDSKDDDSKDDDSKDDDSKDDDSSGGSSSGGSSSGGSSSGGSSSGGSSSGGSSSGGSSSGGSSSGGSSSGGSSSGGRSSGGSSTGGSSMGGSSTSGNSMGGATAVSGKTFTDLGGYTWAEDSIYELKDKGIINGISETEYAPASNIKRGDFMLILSRMLSLTNIYTDNFADVPEGSYYYDAIGKARAAGIASGDGVNFMPEDTITRQDLITLAYRAFLNAGYITEVTDYSVLDSFNDRADISEYAVSPMASMVAGGIITGDGTNVNPQGFATRAEVAVMCGRLLKLIK